MFDVGLKAVSTTLKLMASNTADETHVLLVLLSSKLQQKESQNKLLYMVNTMVSKRQLMSGGIPSHLEVLRMCPQ